MDDIKITFLSGFSADVADTNEQHIALRIDSISGHQINMAYTTIVGNCPKRYGNKLQIWKGDGVKWGVEPSKTVDIPNNDQNGQILIDKQNIGKNSFTIGYSVGPSAQQTAACVIIPSNIESERDYQFYSSTIAMTAANDTSVSFHYKALDGYMPMEYGAWVGIWESKRVPYEQNNPVGRCNIDSNSEEGDGTITDIELASGQYYSLGLYLPGTESTGNYTYLAASYTFQY